MQRERKIIIKACDKGAGIMMLDFTSYMKACYKHLMSSQQNLTECNEENMFYKKEDDFDLERAKSHIKSVLEEALAEEIIDKKKILVLWIQMIKMLQNSTAFSKSTRPTNTRRPHLPDLL